jgi:hypothetical protein
VRSTRKRIREPERTVECWNNGEHDRPAQEQGAAPRSNTVSEATADRLDEHSEDADAALAELWDRYVTDRTPELRDRLILH